MANVTHIDTWWTAVFLSRFSLKISCPSHKGTLLDTLLMLMQG